VLLLLSAFIGVQAQTYDSYWGPGGGSGGGRGWATSAFQEQHGPPVKGQPRYRPAGPKYDYKYKHVYKPRYKPRYNPRMARHYHGPSRPPEVRGWVDYGPGRDDHRHRAGNVRRDATGDVQCWPHVEAWSVEANTEDGAWKDAQRNWENQVRAMYGERFMDIGNSKEGGERQCWTSSGNQSVAGRVAETVGRVVGSDSLDGRKHRCRIMLRPCQAPKELNPQTKAEKN
jgi:hypothetical protein